MTIIEVNLICIIINAIGASFANNSFSRVAHALAAILFCASIYVTGK